MEDRSLEHGLAQKLMVMENAAARVATVRAQLRTNVDQARKEIRAVMSQQMLLIRAREQELLDELDVIMNCRERSLESQQQSLYRNIWECKQALEKLRETGSSSTRAADVLASLGHVEMSARESAHVSFESDALGLRSTLLSFGTIRTSSKHDSLTKSTPGESLPMELEEYDDDHVMAHKSVFHSSSTRANSSSMSKEQVDSVRKWLKKIPSGSAALEADMSAIMAEFDVVKTSSSPEAEVESSDTASSFDLIAHDATPARTSADTAVQKVLSAEFLNTLQQPLSSWLMRLIPNESLKVESEPTIVTPEPSRTMKRPHSCSDVKRHYEFEDVIDRVRASSNDSWVLGSEPLKKTRTEDAYAKDESSMSEQECEAQTPVPFNENEFLANLSKLFVCPMRSTPSLGSPPDGNNQGIDLTTVLGWKRVLEKIEQAAPYWLKEASIQPKQL
uniref:GTD-binding domain-containing protein n=1 Tax=Haemonchus contortus TaxID=6289 RepID=A0A7I4YUB6_HAECO